MYTTYKALGGESFADVSSRAYGTPSRAGEIRSANVGISEPLRVGDALTIPRTAKLNALRETSGVSINVDGVVFRGFTSTRLERVYDGIDTLSIEAPLIVGQFKPFEFNDVQAWIDGELVFTGALVNVSPSTDAYGSTVSLSCYSRAGALAETSSPPKQYKNKTLNQIASDQCASYGVSVTGDTGKPFKYVLTDGGPPWALLVSLAKQRGLLVSSTPDGGIEFFTPPTDGAVVATLDAESQPVTGVTPSFNASGIYSSVTARVPASKKNGAGGVHTVKTGFSKHRPFYTELSDTSLEELPDAVDAMVGRMKAERASYLVALAVAVNESGELFNAGQFVTLRAPKAFLDEATKLTARKVTISTNGEARVAALDLVNAGIYGNR